MDALRPRRSFLFASRIYLWHQRASTYRLRISPCCMIGRERNNSREDRRTFNSINTWLAPPFHTAATRKSSESIVWYHMYTHEQQWACLVPPVRPARGIWCTWYLSARGVTCAYFYRLLVPWFGNNNEAQSIPRKKSFCSEGKTASTRGMMQVQLTAWYVVLNIRPQAAANKTTNNDIPATNACFLTIQTTEKQRQTLGVY